MAAPTMTWKQILAFAPCDSERDAARKRLKAALPDYAKRKLTLADAAAAGVSFDGLIWVAGRAADTDPDCARRIRLFGADCAARVAHIANDPRSTAAIVAARQFARGEIDDAAWDAAWDAARDAWDAWDAARDAWDAWDAARAAARDAAKDAARDAETAWQRDRLVAWFSDNEPTDWPISEAAKAEAA